MPQVLNATYLASCLLDTYHSPHLQKIGDHHPGTLWLGEEDPRTQNDPDNHNGMIKYGVFSQNEIFLDAWG